MVRLVGRVELLVSSEEEALKYVKKAVSKFKEDFKPIEFINGKGIRRLLVEIEGKEYGNSSYYYKKITKKEREDSGFADSYQGILGIDFLGLNFRIVNYILKDFFKYSPS